MNRIFSDKIVIAKKRYRCDASEAWLSSGCTTDDCDTEDQKIIIKSAEENNWNILPGQSYRKVKGIYDGDFYTYRAIPGMDLVCSELDMFDE